MRTARQTLLALAALAAIVVAVGVAQHDPRIDDVRQDQTLLPMMR